MSLNVLFQRFLTLFEEPSPDILLQWGIPKPVNTSGNSMNQDSRLVKPQDSQTNSREVPIMVRDTSSSNDTINLPNIIQANQNDSSSIHSSETIQYPRRTLEKTMKRWFTKQEELDHPLQDYIGSVDKETIYDESLLPVYPSYCTQVPKIRSGPPGLLLPPSYQVAMKHVSASPPEFDSERVWIINPFYIPLLAEMYDFGRANDSNNTRALHMHKNPLINPESCGYTLQEYQSLPEHLKTPSALWQRFVAIRMGHNMLAIPRYTNESLELYDPSQPFKREQEKLAPNAPMARLLPLFEAQMKALVKMFWMDRIDRNTARPVEVDCYVLPGIDGFQRDRDEKKVLKKRLKKKLDLFILMEVEDGTFLQSFDFMGTWSSVIRDYY